MRGEVPEGHDHKLTHNVELCNCAGYLLAILGEV